MSSFDMFTKCPDKDLKKLNQENLWHHGEDWMVFLKAKKDEVPIKYIHYYKSKRK